MNKVNQVSSNEPWKDWSKHPVHQKYKCGAKLGAGAFSQVHSGVTIKTGEPVALKIVFKERPGLKKSNITVLRNEVAVLRSLNHKNIIGLKGVIEDDHQIAIVLEKVNGPELEKHVKKVGHYSEERAAYVFYQMVAGVGHMHAESYLHRDLKPENVLVVEEPTKDPKQKLHIKLIDMGMSQLYDESAPVKGVMGTPGYMAPECREMQNHSAAMDVWSLGMMLFYMLRGKLPYTQTQIQKYLYTNIDLPQTAAFSARTGNQQPFSPELESLLISMLKLDPSKRPSCKEILAERWFAQKAPGITTSNLEGEQGRWSYE